MNTSQHDIVQRFVCTSVALRRITGQLSSVSLEEKITTSLQFQALTYLKEHDGATVGELASELSMSSPAIAQFTDRLVHTENIVRKNDKNDRRIVRLSLTEGGRKKLSQMKKKYFEKIAYFLSLIPEKDVKELLRIQTELIRKLEESKK